VNDREVKAFLFKENEKAEDLFCEAISHGGLEG